MISFFTRKRAVPAQYCNHQYRLKIKPRAAGRKPTPPWRRWRKHSVCMTNALAGARPSPQCRLRAESFAAKTAERSVSERTKNTWCPCGSPKWSVRGSGNSAPFPACRSALYCGSSFPARRSASVRPKNCMTYMRRSTASVRISTRSPERPTPVLRRKMI